MAKNREWALTAFYVSVLIWLNAYWCREVFFLDHIGQMNSMHGFWMGLSRLAGGAWYKPTWWRYSYDGMPLEYTYAPLAPSLIAGISKVTGWSLGRAFGVVAGFVFCFGPAAMFLMAREVTRRAGWSFAACLTYCLIAPSQLFAPDEAFSFRHLRDARRILLTFVWDEVPHELALAFVCLAILFLVRGLRSQARGSFVWAGITIALALLANAFGTTALLIALLALWATWDTGSLQWNGAALTLCALAAYLAMCPFLPPSLLSVIGRNSSNSYIAPPWTWVSFATLAGVGGGSVTLWFLSRRWKRWYLRFFLLLAWVYSSIPVLDQWKLHFLPQPGRYKVEMEMWLILLAAFVAAAVIDRAPRAARAVAVLLLLFPAVAQVKSHRRFAKDVLRSSDVRETIEYQTAAWLAANLPDGRVFAPGSIGQWINAFTQQQQFGGGSFPTTPSVPIQLPIFGITYLDTTAKLADAGILWLTAFGVDALVVPGHSSPEYWKPFSTPEIFSGTLPLLWRERDTSIYFVPRRRGGFAHIIPAAAIIRNAPGDFFDLDQIRAYVAALESSANPVAEWRWIDDNHGRVQARLEPGEVVSLQITYNSGWKALAAGKAASITADGLAQMVVHADCSGLCEVDLSYDGGGEGKGLRLLSVITILGVALWVVAGLRARKVARISTS